MDQAIKEKWVAALRSGEFEQARSSMKFRDTYCCLGVLCVVVEADVKEWQDGGFLPYKIYSKVGLVKSNPEVLVEGRRTPLAALNDSGYDFAQIADLIEEQL